MCTVSLVPKGDHNFILTSNRDEAINRKTLPPDFYTINDTRMLFPKDALAGGTWIGLSDHNRMICLLNGGFDLHERVLPYTKSRGIVVLDLLTAVDFGKTVESYNYKGIEPFTIIAADWQSDVAFYELVWDGSESYFRPLEKTTHIWSSSTLYTKQMKRTRETWFREYESQTQLDTETVLAFHRNAGIGDPNVDLQIDRGFLKTRSITQIIKNEEELTMRYENLQDQKVHTVSFEAITI